MLRFAVLVFVMPHVVKSLADVYVIKYTENTQEGSVTRETTFAKSGVDPTECNDVATFNQVVPEGGHGFLWVRNYSTATTIKYRWLLNFYYFQNGKRAEGCNYNFCNYQTSTATATEKFEAWDFGLGEADVVKWETCGKNKQQKNIEFVIPQKAEDSSSSYFEQHGPESRSLEAADAGTADEVSRPGKPMGQPLRRHNELSPTVTEPAIDDLQPVKLTEHDSVKRHGAIGTHEFQTGSSEGLKLSNPSGRLMKCRAGTKMRHALLMADINASTEAVPPQTSTVPPESFVDLNNDADPPKPLAGKRVDSLHPMDSDEEKAGNLNKDMGPTGIVD